MGNKSKKPKTARSRQLARDIGWSQCFYFVAIFCYSSKQMAQLQGVSRLFYKRVAQWVRTVYRNPTLRKSEMACRNPKSTVVFEWPTKAMIHEMLTSGVTPYLIGFENSYQRGTGAAFNLILSNGHRSNQRDAG